ncbi:glycosyltransferase [Capilliphycus salinus ALCB114379]|uniref:glycosyltransferase n=1 Tax=Capilliphycus salinus TaxID=2768948 RepID=UPI0039A70A8F
MHIERSLAVKDMNANLAGSPPPQKEPFYPFSPSSDLLSLLSANAQVIVQVGPPQKTASRYKQINPHCCYIGIVSNSQQAEACQDYDRVIVGDVEQIQLKSLALDVGQVDCLVYDNILSLVENPAKVLQHQSQWLHPEGEVIAAIDNVQYWRKIVNLLQGKWGSLDEQTPTQLEQSPRQEFTLERIQYLFQSAGLQIYEVQTRGQKDEEFQKFLQLMQPMIQALGLDLNRFATQSAAQRYLIRATRSFKPLRRLSIQTIMMAPTACDRLRVLEPDRLTQTLPGTRAVSGVKSFPTVTPIPGEEKVIVWQRTIMSYEDYIPKLRQLLNQDYLIIAEIDDNPLRRREYAENRYLSYRGCHGVQTSTEALGVFLRQLNPNVAVFPNQLGYLPPPREYQTDAVTLFFGALNREKDWKPIIISLNKVLAKYRDKVRVKVIHDRLFFDSLETPHKEFEAFCSYERYQEILHGCDIGLLPLAATPVNLMKSDLKFLECAGHGVAVLASPTVYERSILEGETGLIYRTIKQFETKLNELIVNDRFRQKIAANAYEWVRNHRLLCQHYPQRRSWYLQMRDRLPELNQQLRLRVPELFVE